MHDQATTLREKIRMRQTQTILGLKPGAESLGGPESVQTHVIAVTSGKGGVGKTNTVVNLAAALNLRGKKVLILDADFGLANIDVLLGLAPQHHLGDFLSGEKTLREIIVSTPQGIAIIPAAPGIQTLSHLDESQTQRLFLALDDLIKDYEYFFIDTSAGISDNVTRLLIASQQIIVVSSPDPTAIVDAYALIKIVLQLDPSRQLSILINSVTGSQEAEQIFAQLSRVTQRFLARELRYLGYVQFDDKLSGAVRAQRAVVLEFPFSPSSRCFRNLAKALIPPEAGETGS